MDLPIMTSNMDTITEGEMANYIGEKGGVMTRSAVFCSDQVRRHCGSLTESIYTIVIVVARLTRLNRWINAVIENVTKTEGLDAMTCAAID